MELYGAPTARKVVTVIFAYLLREQVKLAIQPANPKTLPGAKPE
jgi:hypothetical protein